MNKYLNRIERMEIKSGTDAEIWLSMPPDDELYTVKRILPVSRHEVEQKLPVVEYERFKKLIDEQVDARVIEIRWSE